MIIYLSMIEKEHQRTQFEKIYWENRQLMFWQAKKVLKDGYLAEDAVHDAFIRIAENMDTVERLSEQKVKRYVLVAAKNAAIDIFRKRSRQMENEICYEDLEMEPGNKEDLDRLGYAVREMLLALPDQYRDVFLLKYSVGLTNEEIGNLLKLTVSGVKQRITRGKAALKEKLREEGGDGNE